jgi:parallel beta-helix repeat protein
MSNNTNYGTGTLNNNTANNNSAFGSYSLYNNTTANNNVGVGSDTLFYNTTGNNNTAIGSGSMCNNVSGSLNVAIGSSALEGVTGSNGGSNNVAIGPQALYENTGNFNTAVGSYSAINNDGSFNTFLGANTAFDISSNNYAYSTALGYGAKITGSNQMVLGGTGPSGYPEVIVPGYAIFSGGTTGIQVSYPQSSVELALGFTPTNTMYNYGNIMRYQNCDPTGTNNCSPAIYQALQVAQYSSTTNYSTCVYIPEGTFLINSEIDISVNYVKIYGTSKSILKKSSGSLNINMIVIQPGVSYCIIDGFVCDANSQPGVTGVGSGVGILGGSYNRISNMTMKNAYALGIYLTNSATYNTITDCVVFNCGIGISQSNSQYNIISNNQSFSCYGEGITCDTSSNYAVITGNVLYNNSIAGVGNIGMDSANGCTITNNVCNAAAGSAPGLCMQNNQGNSFCNTVSNNSFASNPGGGILLRTNGSYTCYENVISSNVFNNNATYDISINYGCVNNVLSGIQNNAVILDLNTGGVNQKSLNMSLRYYQSTDTGAVTGNSIPYTIIFDTLSYSNITSNASRGVYDPSSGIFTCAVSSMYSVTASTRIEQFNTSLTPANWATLQIIQYRNSSPYQTSQCEFDGSYSKYNLSVTDIFSMITNDTIEVIATAHQGTAANYIVTNVDTTLTINCVG